MSLPAHWHLLNIEVSSTASEVVSDYLWSRGVAAIEEINNGDVIELRTSYGDEVETLAHDIRERFPEVVVTQIVADQSIANTWREFATPIDIDETLRIVPSWSNVDAGDGATDVLIDPEDVFGLGNHPTTIGALRLARTHVAPHSTLFDFGCGSGVLAIAMAKTHHCATTAHDIADNAAEVVSRNARTNNVEVRWATSPIKPTQKFDAVLANILAPVLCEIAPVVRKITSAHSLVVLAGMRTEQWEDVKSYYTWCEEKESLTIDGWYAVALQVKS